jgi:hypothetical protein
MVVLSTVSTASWLSCRDVNAALLSQPTCMDVMLPVVCMNNTFCPLAAAFMLTHI